MQPNQSQYQQNVPYYPQGVQRQVPYTTVAYPFGNGQPVALPPGVGVLGHSGGNNDPQPNPLVPNVVVRTGKRAGASLPSTPQATGVADVKTVSPAAVRDGEDADALPTLSRFVKLPDGVPRPKLPPGVAPPTYL